MGGSALSVRAKPQPMWSPTVVTWQAAPPAAVYLPPAAGRPGATRGLAESLALDPASPRLLARDSTDNRWKSQVLPGHPGVLCCAPQARAAPVCRPRSALGDQTQQREPLRRQAPTVPSSSWPHAAFLRHGVESQPMPACHGGPPRPFRGSSSRASRRQHVERSDDRRRKNLGDPKACFLAIRCME